jgi:hypothetical protein
MTNWQRRILGYASIDRSSMIAADVSASERERSPLPE